MPVVSVAVRSFVSYAPNERTNERTKNETATTTHNDDDDDDEEKHQRRRRSITMLDDVDCDV